MSEKNKFDFKQPYQSGEDFDTYIKETEYHLKNRIDSKTAHSNLITLVAILTIGLISLGGYVFWQMRDNESKLSDLQQKKVAGIQESTPQNIFSGEGFSIVLKNNTPNGFKSEKISVDFPYIKGKKGVETTYASKQAIGSSSVTNSISIVSSENDNKYDTKKFSELVISSLGKDYEVKSEDISIPKNLKLTKIQKIGDSDEINYYTTVTSDNYYVIKVVNESKNYPELDEYTKFTDSFLEGLYLN
jgi:hypothetical protein